MDKANGHDEIPVELFQILKDDAVESAALNMPENLENSAGATGLEKVSFHSNPKERQCQRMLPNYHTVAHISHSSKVMLYILQARIQQYVNCVIPHVQDSFRKVKGTRDQIANISWIIKKSREFQNTSTSTLLTMPKALTVWTTTNCGKFFKSWECQTTWPASWEICMQLRKQQLRTGHEKTDWFQRGKGVCQGCILSPCLFNLYAECIMRNAGLDEAQAGIRIARRNINFRDADDTTLMAESEELKSLLMKVKEESGKVGLKLNIQ